MSRQSVDELCREHEAFLRRLAARLCGSTFEPDDLVQDVLERCMVHCGELPAIDNHRTWMARVMRNLFVDRLRRRASTPEPVPLEDHIATPPREARAWWEAIDGDEVLAQTRRLPEPLRAPFELFAFEGRTYQQIAQELGITKMTVGTRILRARRRLREMFVEACDGGDQRPSAVIATR